MLFNIGQSATIRYKGRLEKGGIQGWRMDRQSYLLMEMPGSTALKNALKDSAELEVAIESKGEVFTVKGGVKSFLEGTNLWVVELKEALKRHSMRKDQRVSCWIPFRIELDFSKVQADDEYREKLEKTFEGKKELPGIITDISMGGMKFFLDGIYQMFAHSVFSFSLDVTGSGNGLPFNCRVLRVEHRVPGYEKKTFFSGTFTNLEAESEKALEDLFHAFHSFMVTR